ncbi:MAG TPA: HAMP domain-containing sensor histidine kinase [Luteolibacter sp.]|nr:HAMP domain-containing sensor histidine kinase [Luteolibacter sp.]
MNSRSRGDDCQDTAEFCSRVAHQLRTPLALLRMRIDNAPPGTPPEFLAELREEVAKLSRFVECSLLVVKARQGMLRPVEVSVRLGGLLREVVESHRPLAEARGLDWTMDVSCDPEIRIDPDLLRQALHALLDNAVRYAGSRLRVTCRGVTSPVVEIDNDCDPDTVAPGGLGLGLPLVNGICDACGWHIESHTTGRDFHALMRFSRMIS